MDRRRVVDAGGDPGVCETPPDLVALGQLHRVDVVDVACRPSRRPGRPMPSPARSRSYQPARARRASVQAGRCGQLHPQAGRLDRVHPVVEALDLVPILLALAPVPQAGALPRPRSALSVTIAPPSPQAPRFLPG